ncbi:hypothetical protein SAMN05421846_101206 [Chryseobacterium taeanense]|uniref:Lipoprotein n=1 Tax=Chryseobacterium taeanense TaxID=311334 RepID=A0A1G8DJH8_9FLAO|nr:hypothetical protein [Chryseobacterium taeanense]SDH57827.1 hypothetical protein SAMN05421846_101206 [Chryseobacterium taeanense]
MIKSHALVATILLFFLGCTKKDDMKYSVGQEWKYKTRQGEENSSLKILKIEEYPTGGKVIHISMKGLKMKNPHHPEGIADKISHVPITEDALDKSVISIKHDSRKTPDSTELDGYYYWKKEFDKGNAGVFSIPVSEIVSLMEESIVSGDFTE